MALNGGSRLSRPEANWLFHLWPPELAECPCVVSAEMRNSLFMGLREFMVKMMALAMEMMSTSGLELVADFSVPGHIELRNGS